MVERITDPHKPVRVHGTGRIPDGHIVPNPPRPQPEPRREPDPAPTAYEWRVFWLTLSVVVLGVLVGVLR